MQLRDHTFMITGASSGLGAACARHFVENGGHVLIADLNRDEGISLERKLGSSARFAEMDVTESEDVQAAIDSADALHGVIQCAGILAGQRIVGRDGAHDMEVFQRVVEVNLLGTFNVMRLAATRIAENKPEADGERGVIVNTSSVATFEGQIGQAAYSASKGGVAAMTLPAARELSARGIRVAAIAPGLFNTSMVHSLPEKIHTSLVSQTVFPERPGEPAEFAALARHIIENPMLNGAVIRLDGAIRMEAT